MGAFVFGALALCFTAVDAVSLPIRELNAAVLAPRDAHIADNVCIDIDNASPPSLRYGFPSWETIENPNCAGPYPPNKDGNCFAHLNAQNECNSFCAVSHGWFYGEPIDTMDGKWCEKNWDCSRSTSISKTDSKSVQTGMSNDESAGLSNTENIQEAIGSSSGSSFGQGVDVGKMGTSVGGAAKDIIKNNKGIEKLRKRVDPVITPSIMFLTTMLPALLNIIGSQNFGMSKGTTQTVTQGSSWARNVGKSKGININNSTSFSIAVSETDNVQKPEYAKDYCGSWFAVPVIGLTCGMGAHGTLTRDPVRRETRCTLDPEDASFGHCFPYHYSDRSQPDLIKHKPVFVLRDCEDGFILPGEWQHPIFAQSFSPKAYVADHIRRFSFFNLKGTDAKPRDDQWIAEGRASNFTFTKTLGPEDHDIEICGRGKYCARHKLTDGNCYNIPRGYAGSKTAHIVSAKTTPGSCCVLFSRPECHGLAQVVKGDIPNLGTVGFAGQAHSMVCNIDEYCNPNRQDELQFTGVVEV